MTISRNSVRRTVKEYLLITFGLLLYSFAWMGVILPAKITGGGATGMSMLIYYVTGGESGGIPVGVSVFGINAILLTIAIFLIGAKFGAKTIYAILVMSFSMSVMQKIVPPDLLGELSDDRLLSAVLGGALSGLGISICFMQGGSTGGTDIVAMIINKYRNVSYGRIMMVCDFFIIGLSYFINRDITTVIYSYLLTVAVSYTLDMVLAGNKQSSQVFIVSRQYKEIADRITTEMGRGVTMLDGVGWYTKEDVKMIMVVCRRNETSVLFRIIRNIDNSAFITVGSVMGVYGQGFEALRK